MQEQKLQDLIDNINEIKLEPVNISSGFGGTSASDIYSLNTATLPALSIVDNNSINWGVSPTLTTGTSFTYNGPNTVWTSTGTGGANIGQSGKISLKGENADVDINGKSLKSWMEKVEERLNILTPNTELEAEWDELRELGERYRELEQRCKEKAETWKKLKAMPPPQVD